MRYDEAIESLIERITAVEAAAATGPAKEATDVTALEARIAALETRVPELPAQIEPEKAGS